MLELNDLINDIRDIIKDCIKRNNIGGINADIEYYCERVLEGENYINGAIYRLVRGMVAHAIDNLPDFLMSDRIKVDEATFSLFDNGLRYNGLDNEENELLSTKCMAMGMMTKFKSSIEDVNYKKYSVEHKYTRVLGNRDKIIISVYLIY